MGLSVGPISVDTLVERARAEAGARRTVTATATTTTTTSVSTLERQCSSPLRRAQRGEEPGHVDGRHRVQVLRAEAPRGRGQAWG